jgi:hypothetical protein
MTSEQTICNYERLAEAYDRQGQSQMRDRFLVLAADAALAAGRTSEAEAYRTRLLQSNPHHLLKPYASLVEAMKNPDVQNYVTALRRSHPPEKSGQLLDTVRREGSESGEAASSSREPNKPSVFRLRDIEDGPGSGTNRLRPTPSPGSPLKGNASRPLPAPGGRSIPAPNHTGLTPDIYPLRRDPNLDVVTPGGEERENRGSVWVCTGLFVIGLIASLVLGACAFLRPFLPGPWLP